MVNKLPANWKLKTLSEVGNIILGGTPDTTKKEYWNGNILWVIPSEVTSLPSKYLYDTERKITELGLKNSSAKIIKPNSLIICTRATIGNCCINKNEVATNQGFKSIIPNEDYDVVFLYYIIINNKQKLISKASGTTFLEISKTNLANLSFYFPPLEEQKRIASALSKIDAYLENTIKLIEEKERFKRGIAKKLLTCKEGENIPEARFKGFEDEWMEVAISKIGTIITGNTPSTKNESFWNGNNVWVTPTDIKQKYISNSERKLTDDGLKKSRKLPANTLLITCIASIGKNAILKCEGACNQQINAIIPNKNYNVDFLYYLFENEKSYLKFKAPQSVIKIMSKSEFSKLVFKFPLLEEQEKIGGYLSLLDKEIDNLKKQKELIKEMKRGAMQKLLSGEVRLSKNAFNENI